jgi:hypothetical protein
MDDVTVTAKPLYGFLQPSTGSFADLSGIVKTVSIQQNNAATDSLLRKVDQAWEPVRLPAWRNHDGRAAPPGDFTHVTQRLGEIV